ncbi:MAG: hypothetical protein K0U10_02815, partial [Gammaproteobacteria bacterium]|nr:hypothetical protein [Gammaproteobacteria bacterium]
KIYLKLLALFIALSSSSVFSGTEDTQTPPRFLSHLPVSLKDGHAIVQLGVYWSHQGQAQHISLEGLIGDTFTVTQHSDSNGLVGVGYFIDGQQYAKFKMTYGVNAFYLPKTAVKGLVIQENLFANLSYDYTVNHFPVYAIAKSVIETQHPNTAFILDAGIGPNFKKTAHFSEQSLDNITLPDQIFSGKSSTTFSATAGFAVRLNQGLGAAPLECGYRFFYLGDAQFNKSSTQINNTLKTGNAYANAVACSIII